MKLHKRSIVAEYLYIQLSYLYIIATNQFFHINENFQLFLTRSFSRFSLLFWLHDENYKKSRITMC